MLTQAGIKQKKSVPNGEVSVLLRLTFDLNKAILNFNKKHLSQVLD